MAVIENNRSLLSVLASRKLTTEPRHGRPLFVVQRWALSLLQLDVNIGFRATIMLRASLRSACMQIPHNLFWNGEFDVACSLSLSLSRRVPVTSLKLT